MDRIATALINLTAFVELSGDDVIDPDDAVRALEGVAADLDGITEEEVAAIRAAIDRLLPSESDIQRRNFLAEFLSALGIEPETENGDNNKGCREVGAIAETSPAPMVEQARSDV